MSTCAPKKKNRYSAKSSTDSLGQDNRNRSKGPFGWQGHGITVWACAGGVVCLQVMQEGSGKRAPMRILSGRKLHHATAELGSINRLDSVPLHMSLTCTAVQAKQKKTKPDPRKRVDFDSYHFVCSAILLISLIYEMSLQLSGGFRIFSEN
ncbi:hypothetical protein NC652_039861 [Populus alba x Populus x berolinensis]|nr:hypothetical protein NC652_039861 [Populus alba x Populus x berolinensis]